MNSSVKKYKQLFVLNWALQWLSEENLAIDCHIENSCTEACQPIKESVTKDDKKTDNGSNQEVSLRVFYFTSFHFGSPLSNNICNIENECILNEPSAHYLYLLQKAVSL